MKSKKIVFPVILLLFSHLLRAQGKTDGSLYTYFDNAVGLTNLGINNGTIHLNPYKPYDRSHRYHVSENYFPGSVFYDGQLYPNENLRYDIFKDVLVVKVSGQNNSTGINLIPEKTKYFTLNNKIFANLTYAQKTPEFVKGFYEEYSADTPVTLYTKYHKDRIEVLTIEGLQYKYEFTSDYIFRYKGNFYKIKNADSFSDVFPANEKSIKDYYDTGRELEKTDRTQFMKNMVNHINNFLTRETN
jgi:hypothetical protein